jgi:hypothetical protein
MTYKNEQCEYTDTTTKRQPTRARTPDEERYGRLLAEIELQKLLEERTTNLQEVKQ